MATALSRPSGRTDTSRTRRRQPVTAPAAPAEKSVPWHARQGVYFVPVRHLSRETLAEMIRRQCLDTWQLLHEALHEEARRGRTEAIRDAARRAILDDVGVMGLHRLSGGDGKRGGISPKTIRRHLELLESMGLVQVCRPPVRFELRNGRLHKAKGHGREMPVRIIITVKEHHCRPTKRQLMGQAARRAVAGSYGASLPIPDPVLMGRPSLPFRENEEQKENETPADTVGVGAAVASMEAGRLPPAEAAGLPAGTQEGGQEAAAPVLPPPRRQARTEAPRRPYRPPEEAPGPTAAEKAAAWHQGAAESARRNAEYLALRAERRKAFSAPTPTPAPAADPDVVAARRLAAAAEKAAYRHEYRVDHGLPSEPPPPIPTPAWRGDGERSQASVLAALAAYAG